MKRNILLVALLVLISTISLHVNAQTSNMEDVVYLKNGSIIHGIIIEQIPNESLKIKTKDGSVFVYKMVEVIKLTKEETANTSMNAGNAYNSNNYIGNQYSNVVAPSYNQIKNKYNYRMYTANPTDQYNPTISGLCSWFIPGLGQVICGETGRGLGYFGGTLACSLVMSLGAGIASASYYDDGAMIAGSLLTLVGAIGLLTVDIAAIVDATRVAKVKNMYINDMRNKTSLNFELSPYVDQISMQNEIVRPVGMTMRVKF